MPHQAQRSNGRSKRDVGSVEASIMSSGAQRYVSNDNNEGSFPEQIRTILEYLWNKIAIANHHMKEEEKMSTSYGFSKEISANDLFDGRLAAYGVRENVSENTTETSRALTDGRNYLRVEIRDGLVSCFTRYAQNGDPGKILEAITDAFNVKIVSEHEPQAWGFDTQEEWDAALEAMAKEYAENSTRRS
jgi:hypothetical protein